MDERTEIRNHRTYLCQLKFTGPQGEIAETSQIDYEVNQMEKRFAHTFFFPNRYAKDFRCDCGGYCSC